MRKHIEILDIDENLIYTSNLQLSEYYLYDNELNIIKGFDIKEFNLIKNSENFGIGKKYSFINNNKSLSYINYNEEGRLINILHESIKGGYIIEDTIQLLIETLNIKNSSIHLLTGRGHPFHELKEFISTLSEHVTKKYHLTNNINSKIGDCFSINSQEFKDLFGVKDNLSSIEKKIIGFNYIILKEGQKCGDKEVTIRYSDDLSEIIGGFREFIVENILGKKEYNFIKNIELVLTIPNSKESIILNNS